MIPISELSTIFGFVLILFGYLRSTSVVSNLVVIIRSCILRVKLPVVDILSEAAHVLRVVVHPLHAAGQSPAGGQVEGLQGGAGIQQLGQRLETYTSVGEVQFPAIIKYYMEFRHSKHSLSLFTSGVCTPHSPPEP